MVERIMATKIGEQELKPLDKQFDEAGGWAEDMARRTPGDPGGGRGTQAKFDEIDPRDKPVSINEPPWVHTEPQEDPHNPKPRDYQENPKVKENEASRKAQLEDEQRRVDEADKRSSEGFNAAYGGRAEEEGASKRKQIEDDKKQKERDREQEEQRKRKAKQEEEEEDAKEPNKRRR